MFTRDQIADALRSRYPIVQQTGDWRPLAQYVVDLVELAVKDEREACANVVDGETCAGYCDCFSCDMLNKIAATIRARGKP